MVPLAIIFIGAYFLSDSYLVDKEYSKSILYSERKIKFFWGGISVTIGCLWIVTVYMNLPLLSLIGLFLIFTTLFLYIINNYSSIFAPNCISLFFNSLYIVLRILCPSVLELEDAVMWNFIIGPLVSLPSG